MKKQAILLVAFFLSCLLFSSCSSNKPDKNDKESTDLPVDPGKKIEANTGGMLYPCHWSFTVEQIASGEATLISTAKIDSGWHLYSQLISDKGTPTKFTYAPLTDYKLIGNTEEGSSHKEYDKYLEIDILYFEKEAVFRQKIKVTGKKDFVITGTINYTACLTQCVTSDEEFSFNIKGNPQGE